MADSEIPRFRRSSRCGDVGCVEVASVADGVLMRDSKVDDGTILAFDAQAWTDFVAGVRDGDFD